MNTINMNDELAIAAHKIDQADRKAERTEQVFDGNLVKKSTFASKVTDTLFKAGVNLDHAIVVGCAFAEATNSIHDYGRFMKKLGKRIKQFTGQVIQPSLGDGRMIIATDLTMDVVEGYLIDADLLEENGFGRKLPILVRGLRNGYLPVPAMVGITPENRRFDFDDSHSDLMKRVIKYLNAIEFTKDSVQEKICNETYRLHSERNSGIKNNEQHVLAGCALMDDKVAYVSENSWDKRPRMYQANCSGPQWAGSDEARSLMDLWNVPTDYNVKDMIKVISDEVMDMITIKSEKTMMKLCYRVEDIGYSEFLYMWDVAKKLKEGKKELTTQQQGLLSIKKARSFVKAARILIALEKGEKPYVGMAAGLDAKCSGPQLGALMVGDSAIAKICGVSLNKQVMDAYKVAIVKLEKRGYVGFTRDLIKVPYMGIFYSQGYHAFSYENADCDGDLYKAVQSFQGNHDPKTIATQVARCNRLGESTDPEHIKRLCNAFIFHKEIESSFGTVLGRLRKIINSFNDIEFEKDAMGNFLKNGASRIPKRDADGKVVRKLLITKPTDYRMADGTHVVMNYKKSYDANGQVHSHETQTNVEIVCGETEYNYLDFKVKSNEDDLANEIRTTFVNFIQATDALVARVCMDKLREKGVQHALNIHDCFRVNATQMPLLEEAIKETYLDLFGMEEMKATSNLPCPDMLANLFKGLNESVADDEKIRGMSIFDEDGDVWNDRSYWCPDLKKVVTWVDCFEALGKGAEYFSK